MNKIKIRIMTALLLGTLMLQPTTFVSAVEVNESENLVQEKFDKINKIEFSQVSKLGERECIVYYYMDRCYYCNSIKSDVVEFAEKLDYKGIYAVQMNSEKNSYGFYSMKAHHAKYDIEIGEIDQDGNIRYYEGESKEKYLSSTDISYGIAKTDSENYERYKRTNKNAEPNKVYAVDYTPRIDTDNIENFRIKGTPTAIYIKKGKILKCAVGTDQILELFDGYNSELEK